MSMVCRTHTHTHTRTHTHTHTHTVWKMTHGHAGWRDSEVVCVCLNVCVLCVSVCMSELFVCVSVCVYGSEYVCLCMPVVWKMIWGGYGQ